MESVEILKELNRQGGRKVPEDAPTSFVPARYAEYLEKARAAGDDTAYRHYWELCVVLGLRDGAAVRGRLRARVTPLRRPRDVLVHHRSSGPPGAPGSAS
jgi:hypothetical protein